MHVLAVPLFLDATGVAVALTAWARHRCLQLYSFLVFFAPPDLRVKCRPCVYTYIYIYIYIYVCVCVCLLNHLLGQICTQK